jgi:hypothetical protein
MAGRSQTKSAAKGAGRQAAGQLDGDLVTKVGRFGVAGLGVVYLLLAWLAAQVAFGSSDQSADNTGALKELAGNGAGKFLLGVLAVAFAVYALWQLFEALSGFHHYQGRKRTTKRVGAVVKALIGAALAVTSARLLAGSGQKDASDQQADLTARLLEAPAGRVLVVLVGLGIVAFSAYLVYRGVTKGFLEKLQGTPDKRVQQLGVAGYVARGVAFGVLGVLVVVAGVQSDADEARGLDAALKTLAEQPFGTVLLLIVALGLAAFGVYELMTAKQAREG